MVNHAIREGIRFDYLLADSWFTCTDIVKFIKSRHMCCHYLGMSKMGKTKYLFEKKLLSAKELVKLLQARKAINYSRKMHCNYEVADVELAVIQLSVTERIWGLLKEIVRIIAEAFETDDERVMDALINRSETFKHYINFDRLTIKQAA